MIIQYQELSLFDAGIFIWIEDEEYKYIHTDIDIELNSWYVINSSAKYRILTWSVKFNDFVLWLQVHADDVTSPFIFLNKTGLSDSFLCTNRRYRYTESTFCNLVIHWNNFIIHNAFSI